MLQVLQVHSQRGVANALHVWIQFHGTLRACNAHIPVHDVTTWSWVNLVNEPHSVFCTDILLADKTSRAKRQNDVILEKIVWRRPLTYLNE